MPKQWLFWFEELGKEHSNLVGKKCANLGELTRIGLPVPPKIVCEANWGLGESVVSGRMSPDFFLLDKESLEILIKRLGQKEMCISCGETGVIEEEVPHERRSRFCLDDEEVKEIANSGKFIEEDFNGVPQDIEWAINDELQKGGNFFFTDTPCNYSREKKYYRSDSRLDHATETLKSGIFGSGISKTHKVNVMT